MQNPAEMLEGLSSVEQSADLICRSAGRQLSSQAAALRTRARYACSCVVALLNDLAVQSHSQGCSEYLTAVPLGVPGDLHAGGFAGGTTQSGNRRRAPWKTATITTRSGRT